jgi:hypothetical protein
MAAKKQSRAKLLSRLDESQREAANAIIDKIDSNTMLAFKDVGLLGVKPARVPGKTLCTFVGVTDQSLRNWVKEGMPRNQDGTYNSVDVFKWIAERNKARSENDLDREKKEADIEYKRAQTEKLKDMYILRSEYEKMLCSMAQSLRNFLENSRPMNDHHFVGLSLDEARLRRQAEVIQMMKAFTGGIEWLQ